MANENRADFRRKIRSTLSSWPKDKTTLSSAVNATTTTIPLTAVTDIVARDILQVGSEVMRAISVSTLNMTVMRGDRGTIAASHLINSVVTVWSNWEWTDMDLNDEIDVAFDWLFPDVWYPKYYSNTVLAEAIEFGLPEGVRYPDGEQVKRVELLSDDGVTYVPIYGWRHENDRIILEHGMDCNRTVRLTTHGKHIRLTDDETTIYDGTILNAIRAYVIHLCIDKLLANRSRYVEYSAALNDRAATIDELSRLSYNFYNQATLAKDAASRPPLSGFASTRRKA